MHCFTLLRRFRFGSRDEEIEWERISAKNALKFKEMVEGGHHIPDELRRKIEEKVDRSPAEEELLKKAKRAANKRDKVRFSFVSFWHWSS
jgi:hypothetical protein